MLYALLVLLACQWLGELLVAALHLPLPGALLGTLLLLLGLLVLGRIPQGLQQTGGTLLQHMMLLFIPSIAGVMLQWDTLAREWQPWLVAGIVGTAITLVVTALTFRWMLARTGVPHATDPPAGAATPAPQDRS